jgi:hypothetical protein
MYCKIEGNQYKITQLLLLVKLIFFLNVPPSHLTPEKCFVFNIATCALSELYHCFSVITGLSTRPFGNRGNRDASSYVLTLVFTRSSLRNTVLAFNDFIKAF